MNKPELPPGYTVTADTHEVEGMPFEFGDGKSTRWTETRANAVREAWTHWRLEGDPAWVAYIDSLPGPNDLQREPFETFADVSPEQLEIATAHSQGFAEVFTAAGMGDVTPTHSILSRHLHEFGQEVLRESGKNSPVTRKLFDDSTAASQAGLLMLAALLQRLYSAPYPDLNTAAVDFVNVLTAVVDLAATTARPKIKHGSQAKGKRPT